MDKLLAMNTFVQIVERGSLTAAAEALNKSLPSVVRVLATLEQSLDVRLLNRTTRRMTLTDEGRQYLTRCQQILSDVEEAELELSAQQREPSGHLNITAPIMFGKMHVTPAITSFLQQHKRVEVDLLLLDRTVNLIEEGIDVAVRIGHLSDSSMIAKPVGKIRRVLCASPDYLKKREAIKRPEDITAHNCVRFTGLSTSNTWQFVEKGKPLSIPIKGSFGCNQANAAIDACVAGLGIGMFLSYQVEPQVQAGKLKILLPEFEPLPMPVNIIYSHAKLISTRVRVFVEWITQALRDELTK